MPTRRTSDSHEQFVKSRQRRGKRKSALSLQQKIAVQAIAKKAVEAAPEMKVYDDVSNNQTIVNASVITDVSTIGQGTADGSRVGDDVLAKYFAMRYRVVANTSGTNEDQSYRIILFQWFPNSADVAPVVADILETPTQTQSFYFRNRSNQFKVLYDNQGLVARNVGSSDHMMHFDVTIPGKALRKIQYNDSNLTGSNHLYLLMFSNEVTNAPRALWTSRLGYIDQ